MNKAETAVLHTLWRYMSECLPAKLVILQLLCSFCEQHLFAMAAVAVLFFDFGFVYVMSALPRVMSRTSNSRH